MWKNMDKFKNLSTFYHINYNKKFIILKYNFFIKRLDLKILVLTYGCSIVQYMTCVASSRHAPKPAEPTPY